MSRNKLKSALVPYGFITPATLTIVLLVLYPIMYGIYISFFDTNLVNKWNFVPAQPVEDPGVYSDRGWRPLCIGIYIRILPQHGY